MKGQAGSSTGDLLNRPALSFQTDTPRQSLETVALINQPKLLRTERDNCSRAKASRAKVRCTPEKSDDLAGLSCGVSRVLSSSGTSACTRTPSSQARSWSHETGEPGS